MRDHCNQIGIYRLCKTEYPAFFIKSIVNIKCTCALTGTRFVKSLHFFNAFFSLLKSGGYIHVKQMNIGFTEISKLYHSMKSSLYIFFKTVFCMGHADRSFTMITGTVVCRKIFWALDPINSSLTPEAPFEPIITKSW